jgi:6-phosphofructokinase 1
MSSTNVSSADRDEAYLVGEMGIQALLAGESDKMITLVRQTEPAYHCTTGLADLDKVANVQRLLPDEYLNDDKTMITPAFYEYALPLIGGPLASYEPLKLTRIHA